MRIRRPSYRSYGSPEHKRGMLLYYYFSNRIVRYFFWSRLRSLLSLVTFRPQDRVLEIGFGPGVMFPSLANVCNHIIGIDPMFDSISTSPVTNFRIVKNMCRFEGIEGKVELIRADAQNIPVERETCDVVIATDVLEHIPDLLRNMREIDRILKKDGALLACIPMENFYRRTARKLFRLPKLHEEEHFYKNILNDIESVLRITKMRGYPAILPICLLVTAEKKSSEPS